MKPTKIGITGVRGIVGELFTPELVVEFAQAFVTYMDCGRILVCRDTRPSEPMVLAGVSVGLLAAGCEVTGASARHRACSLQSHSLTLLEALPSSSFFIAFIYFRFSWVRRFLTIDETCGKLSHRQFTRCNK